MEFNKLGKHINKHENFSAPDGQIFKLLNTVWISAFKKLDVKLADLILHVD